jgi:serine/threonine protein kinase
VLAAGGGERTRCAVWVLVVSKLVLHERTSTRAIVGRGDRKFNRFTKERNAKMSREGKVSEWHMDFASKVQENTDGHGRAGAKVSDDPLTKTVRSRDLRREMAAAMAGMTSPSEGGEARRAPRRAPPQGPPPGSSPINSAVRRQTSREAQAGSKTSDVLRTGVDGIRPPPRSPFRPPPGNPPDSAQGSRSHSRVRMPKGAGTGTAGHTSHTSRPRPPRPGDRKPPPPRGINPHSIENRDGASTARLVAFATQHQARIQRMQRQPPTGPAPPGGGVGFKPPPSRESSVWKPPPPSGTPPPADRTSGNVPRKPPRPGNGKKPPPPSGPPPASALEAGRRARSRQSGDGFGLVGTGSDGEDKLADRRGGSKIEEVEDDAGSKVAEPRKSPTRPAGMKKRPNLSVVVDDSNKFSDQPPVVVDEGKVGEEAPARKEVKKKKKKRPNLSVMIDDSNHEAAIPAETSGGGGNPFGVGALQVTTDEADFNQTYKMTNSGSFTAEGFLIRETGIARAPGDGKNSSRDWEEDEIGSDGYAKNIKQEMLKLCVLGRGASGIVYKSLHLPTMRIVAVKNIPVYETEKRHQMVKELKALYKNLVPITGDGSTTARGGTKYGPCPQIVSFHDAFMNPEEGNISIILEYMDGGSLQDIVDTGGCAQESVLANVSYRVLVALKFIHDKHQLHRDIKPSNLLINHNGEVKVSDFGIVREMESTVAKANTFVGTLTYMSPERISGEEYSYASDIWSFGLSILAVAIGKYPMNTEGGYWGLLHNLRDEPSPKLPEDEFSPEFCEFIDLTLCKDPKERWDCESLLNHPFLEGCGDAMDQQTQMMHEQLMEDLAGLDEEQEDEDMQSQGSDTARTELDEICELSMNLLYDLWSSAKRSEDSGAGKSKDGASTRVPDRFPRVQRTKLVALASQLGLPVGSVRRCFERKWRELTGSGSETARIAERDANRQPDMTRMLVAEGTTGKKK